TVRGAGTTPGGARGATRRSLLPRRRGLLHTARPPPVRGDDPRSDTRQADRRRAAFSARGAARCLTRVRGRDAAHRRVRSVRALPDGGSAAASAGASDGRAREAVPRLAQSELSAAAAFFTSRCFTQRIAPKRPTPAVTASAAVTLTFAAASLA